MIYLFNSVISEITIEFGVKQPLRIKAGLMAVGPGEASVEHAFNVLQNVIPAENKARALLNLNENDQNNSTVNAILKNISKTFHCFE